MLHKIKILILITFLFCAQVASAVFVVPQGGTGADNFTPHLFIMSGTSSDTQLQASSSPSVLGDFSVIGDFITFGNATTSLTQYIGGTLTVDGLTTLNGFISQASSTVSGAFHISDHLSASSTSSFAGLAIFEGGLISQASSTFSGKLNINTIDVGEDLSFFESTITHPFNATTTSDGSNIDIILADAEDYTGEMVLRFSDGYFATTTTPIIARLTAGTDTVPQKNYVYIPISTKSLTVSTSDWPVEEHIRIAFFFCQSASNVQSEGGCFVNQNWNDFAHRIDGQGGWSTASQCIRYGAGYFSGLDPNGTDQDVASSYFNSISATEAYYKATAGSMCQKNLHTMPATDTQNADEDMHVINSSVSAYRDISDFTDIQADSLGGSLSNKYFGICLFEVGNKTDQYSPVMVKLPSGSYTKQTDAEQDFLGFDDCALPREFVHDARVSVPVVRMTLRYTGGFGTLSHISSSDLREEGNTSGSSGVGVTTLLGLVDTPSSFTSQANKGLVVNGGETVTEFTSVLFADGTINSTGLQTFNLGFLSNASSTVSAALHVLTLNASTTSVFDNLTVLGICTGCGESFSWTVFSDRNATTTLLDFQNGFISSASSSISSTLHVANNLSASSTLAVDGQSLFALTGGSVGIGNVNPQELLHVGAGTDASDISATDLLVTRAGPSNLSVRDSTNGVETFLFSSSVGGIMGTVTNDPLNIQTNNTSAIFIDASQKVGIGTASPDNILTVNGDANISNGSGLIIGHPSKVAFPNTASEFQILGTGAGIDSEINMLRSSADAFGSILYFAKSRDAIGTFTTDLEIGDDLGTIAWVGSDGGAADLGGDWALIKAEVDATPAGTNDHPGRLAFYTTADGGNIATERMRIDSSGNVGIGTTSPSAALSVLGTGEYVAYFEDEDNDTTPPFVITGAGKVGIGTTSPVATLGIDGSLGVNATHLVLDSSGNVGIGVASPRFPLRIRHSDQPTTFGNPTLQLGETEFSASGVATLGFGWCSGITCVPPVEIGHKITDAGGNTKGALIFGTRDTTGATDIATERMRIDSAGRVGIGDTSPDALFEISSSTPGVVDLFNISDNSDGDIFTVEGGGNVGIGSTSPFAKFSIGDDGAIVTAEKTLTDQATIAVSWLDGNQQKVILGDNRTVNFSNFIDGQTLRLIACQDSTGSRVITWGTVVLWDGGSAPTLTTTGDKCDVLTFLATQATSTLTVFGSSVLNF